MIIPSLLDADIYKLSMMQVVLHQFPGAEVEYRFHCRTEGVDLTLLLPMLDAEIEHLWMNDRTRIRFARSNWKKLLRRPSAKPCDRSAAAPGRAAHNVNPNRRPHTPAGQHSV